MKIIKKLFKILGILIAILLLAGIVLYFIFNKSIPEGIPGKEADAIALKMLKRINIEAYKDTRYIEWSFIDGKHQYKWDKENGIVRVSWDEHTALLNLNNLDKSTVESVNLDLSDSKKEELVQTALAYFNNDSFWVVAPFKIFDEGVERQIVEKDDGSKGLLVTYNSGGSTPGDSYLWNLSPDGFPMSYQMWVKIIPVGGLIASWDDWQIMESGAFLPSSHKLGPVTLKIEDLRAYN